MFNISAIHLWNRTKTKSVDLAAELNEVKETFRIKALQVFIHDSVAECVAEADIIVTATFASSPLLFADMLKSNVHINGKFCRILF